jgi:hypothetical protein
MAATGSTLAWHGDETDVMKVILRMIVGRGARDPVACERSGGLREPGASPCRDTETKSKPN